MEQGEDFAPQDFNIQHCINNSFLPEYLSGEIILENKKYIVQELGAKLIDVRSLITEEKLDELKKLLEASSSEIIEIIPEEVLPNPEDENTAPIEPTDEASVTPPSSQVNTPPSEE